ncbi:MAG: FecR family protein [Draconibacterium sp.]
MSVKNDSEKYKITSAEFHKMDTEEKILKAMDGFGTPEGMGTEEALEALFKKADARKPAKFIRLSRYLQAAAAVVVLLLGFYTVNNVFSHDKVKTAFAEQTKFSLPDGTQVALNAGSKITWSEKNFPDHRSLKLNGEAYFNVKKGSRFSIHTKNGTVEILGTQLNVFSRNNEFWVSCISGKVKVSSANKTQIIRPGEMAELTPSGLVKTSENNIERTISWQNGVFYFEDQPLVSIFDALERQFDVNVSFNGNNVRSMTVTFSNKSLQEALDVICIPMGLKYEIKNNKVHIFEPTE